MPVVKAAVEEKKKEVPQMQEPEVKIGQKKEQAGNESAKKPRTKPEMGLIQKTNGWQKIKVLSQKMFGSRKK